MQPISSMIRRTGTQVRRQQELLAGRARKASTSFASETRTVGREIASAVRGEADAWTKYVRDSATVLADAVAPRSIERGFLSRVSSTLRALDARLRQRIHALESRGRARLKAKPRVKRQPVAH